MEYLLEIGYKSGNKVKIWLKEYELKVQGSELNSISTLTTKDNKILYYGVHNIEYIVLLKTRKSYCWGLFKF